MAEGKTLEMIQHAQAAMYRAVFPYHTVRDRSLAGKKRIRARKVENKKGK